MTPLASTILHMLTWYVTRDLEPVYAPHMRHHPLGAELGAEQHAERLRAAAELAGVPLHLLAALDHDESGFDPAARSSEGALGELQLLPASRWGQAWLRECKLEDGHCDELNVLWGAYALRDALDACGGSEHLALGFYRSGRCVAGPRGRRTLELSRWLRWRLEGGQ